MANTLGTLSTGILLRKALDLVFTKRPLLQAISLDLKPVGAKLNETVKARIHAIPTVDDFGSAAVAKVDTDVPVTLSAHKEVRHEFTAAEINSTDRNLIEEAARPMAVAVRNHLVDAIAALWTPANFPNETVEALASVDYRTLTTLRGALSGRGAPEDGEFALVNADAYTELLNDSTVINASQNDTGENAVVQRALLRGVADFDFVGEYPALPSANNLIGFAGSKDSTVLSTRVPSDPREVLPNAPFPGNVEVISEPATGFSVLAVEYINPSNLAAVVYLTWIYGVAVGNASNGQRLVTSATGS